MNLKREFLETLSDSDFQGFAEDGQPCFFSPFELDNDRALQISKGIAENIQEELNDRLHSMKINRQNVLALGPNDFIRIGARNLDLYTPIEIAHFTYMCASIHLQTIQRFKTLESAAELGHFFRDLFKDDEN